MSEEVLIVKIQHLYHCDSLEEIWKHLLMKKKYKIFISVFCVDVSREKIIINQFFGRKASKYGMSLLLAASA